MQVQVPDRTFHHMTRFIPATEVSQKARPQLRYDAISGMPPRGHNQQRSDDNDPSHMGQLQLIGRDYPSGNGAGPEIEKISRSARAYPVGLLKLATGEVPQVPQVPRKPLTPGLSAVFDSDAWNTHGTLQQKQPYGLQTGAPLWQGMTPNLPFMSTSPWQLARNFRDGVQSAKIPDWIAHSDMLRTGAGAGLGGILGAGAGLVSRFLGVDTPPPSHLAMFGSALGGLLGNIRGGGKP